MLSTISANESRVILFRASSTSLEVVSTINTEICSGPSLFQHYCMPVGDRLWGGGFLGVWKWKICNPLHSSSSVRTIFCFEKTSLESFCFRVSRNLWKSLFRQKFLFYLATWTENRSFSQTRTIFGEGLLTGKFKPPLALKTQELRGVRSTRLTVTWRPTLTE